MFIEIKRGERESKRARMEISLRFAITTAENKFNKLCNYHACKYSLLDIYFFLKTLKLFSIEICLIRIRKIHNSNAIQNFACRFVSISYQCIPRGAAVLHWCN